MTAINLELKVNNKKMIKASGIMLGKGEIVWTDIIKEGIIKQGLTKCSFNDIYNKILKDYNNEKFELNLRIDNYLKR